MKRFTLAMVLLSTLLLTGFTGCDFQPSSDQIQQDQQEKILAEGTAQTGMPAIKNFRERKLLKDIIEMRDNETLTTYTYIVAEMTGKTVFLCNSIGYGIPAATQYTNPQKADYQYSARLVMPQADPNGLFSPSAAEGTWVMCVDPNGGEKAKTLPVYVEPRIMVSPFKLQTSP